jgi:hypothetical protein
MITIWIFVGLLILLGVGASCAWRHWCTVSLAKYRWSLNWAAVLACIYGAITIYRVVTNLSATQPDWLGFQNELLGYILFWVFLPPLWFFLEYYAVDNDFIVYPDNALAKSERLQQIKNYADYASKIWLALAGLLVAVAAFKK